MANNTPENYCCSFCGKSQANVRKLLAGPDNVFICDECVELCYEIVKEEFGEEPFDDASGDFAINLLKPREIREFLDKYVIGQD